jgi:hypothetical protein
MATGNEMGRRKFIKQVAGAAAGLGLTWKYNLGSAVGAMLAPNYVGKEDIEDRFFDDDMNTRLSLNEMERKYGVSGRDEIVGNVSMRVMREYNEGSALFSDSLEKKEGSPNAHGVVKPLHEKTHQTWYHYSADAITKKMYGVESDFVDVV